MGAHPSDPPASSSPASGRMHRAPSLLAAGLAAFAAALVLRLTGLDSRDLWLDEIYTQFAASRDWLGLVDDRVSRGHSPFYFAVLKLSGIDPANISGLRALSAVFDAGAAGVLAAGALRYFGVRAAILVALLYVLSPLHIHWAQNARPYGLLMLFTAMGLVGAVGLLDTIGTGDRDRAPDASAPHWLFVIGWSGAAFTLTGGILAYLVVLSLPWWPGLRKGRLANPDFRRRWIRAQKIPSIVAFLTYALMSRVHVVDRIGNYWLETRRPFGLESLAMLAEEVGAGDVGQAAAALPAAGPTLSVSLMAVTLAGILGAAGWAASRAALRPRSFAVTALGFGLLGLMLMMSVHTSLLTGRYFTPAWMALLVGAAIGLAALRPVSGIVLGALLAGAMLPFALGAVTSEAERRALAPQRIAAIIDADPARLAPIVIDRSIFREVRMELMLLRLDEPALPRPDMHGETQGDRARGIAEAGGPFFIVAAHEAWADLYAPDHVARACLASEGKWTVARISDQDCAPPFESD